MSLAEVKTNVTFGLFAFRPFQEFAVADVVAEYAEYAARDEKFGLDVANEIVDGEPVESLAHCNQIEFLVLRHNLVDVQAVFSRDHNFGRVVLALIDFLRLRGTHLHHLLAEVHPERPHKIIVEVEEQLACSRSHVQISASAARIR